MVAVPLSALALVTLNDAKAFIGGEVTAAQETLIEGMIEAASRLILEESGREFLPQSDDVGRTVQYDGGRLLSFAPYDARDVDSITIHTTALTIDTHFELVADRRNADVFVGARLSPSLRIDERELGVVTIVGDWGWPEVPERIKRACLRIVDAWYVVDGPAHAEEYGDAPDIVPGLVPMDAWAVINDYRRASI